jgi:hypothetical protein
MKLPLLFLLLSLGSLFAQNDLVSRLGNIKKLTAEQKVILQDSIDLTTAAIDTQARTQTELLALKADHQELGFHVQALGKERDGWKSRSDWFENAYEKGKIETKKYKDKYGFLSGRVHLVALGVALLVGILASGLTWKWAMLVSPVVILSVGGGAAAAAFALVQLVFRYNL